MPIQPDWGAPASSRHAALPHLVTLSSTGWRRTVSSRSWVWSMTAWCFPAPPGRSFVDATDAERVQAGPRLAVAKADSVVLP